MVRHAFPVRGNSQFITRRYGSPLDGIRSIAFLAKGLACSSVCRLSLGSDIHSRMIFRRISCSGLMLEILALNRGRRQRNGRAVTKIRGARNVSGDLFQDTDLHRTLVSQGVNCFRLCFLARILSHQHSELVFDDECRRKLEFSSKPMGFYFRRSGLKPRLPPSTPTTCGTDQGR